MITRLYLRLFRRALWQRIRNVEYMLEQGWLFMAQVALYDALRHHGQHSTLVQLQEEIDEYHN